ncbi:MAG: hypothetical protein ABIO83_07030 [Ilumatobacteraceae bacterium]
MGPSIILPVLLLAVLVPVVATWAKRTLKGDPGTGDDTATAPSARLTSTGLRGLPTPPWRVVHEIAGKLGGVQHVLIGPPGIYAVETTMEPLPAGPVADPGALDLAAAAIARGRLDDVLRRCAMSSDRLVRVHWGANPGATVPACEILPGLVGVDGRSIDAWAAGLTDRVLTPAQVDLAWQTVVTSIGRPDPLA